MANSSQELAIVVNYGNLLSTLLDSLIQSISGSQVVSSGTKDGAQGINSKLNNSQRFQDAVAPDATNPIALAPSPT